MLLFVFRVLEPPPSFPRLLNPTPPFASPFSVFSSCAERFLKRGRDPSPRSSKISPPHPPRRWWVVMGGWDEAIDVGSRGGSPLFPVYYASHFVEFRYLYLPFRILPFFRHCRAFLFASRVESISQNKSTDNVSSIGIIRLSYFYPFCLLATGIEFNFTPSGFLPMNFVGHIRYIHCM